MAHIINENAKLKSTCTMRCNPSLIYMGVFFLIADAAESYVNQISSEMLYNSKKKKHFFF